MIQTVDFNTFRDSFTGDRKNQFSYEALELIFDYFEEVDPHWELDPVAICCEFAEMTLAEFNDCYGYASEDEPEFPTLESAEQHVEDNGHLVGRTPNNTIVFTQF